MFQLYGKRRESAVEANHYTTMLFHAKLFYFLQFFNSEADRFFHVYVFPGT